LKFGTWSRFPFPYTNRPAQQRRPALVIARHSETGSPALLWVLMVTSASYRRWTGDVEVSDLAAAGLPAASIVRSAKIATIEAADADRIGSLAANDRLLVRDQVAGLLAPVLGC